MTSCPHPPTHFPTVGPITQTRDAAEYLQQHNLTGLLNSMMAGLMMALPEDHVDYMQHAVNSAREIGLENVDLHTFVWPLHPHRDPLRRKLLHPPVEVDGGNLPVGVLEKRDFTLSLTDEETLRRPRLPFWHIDYFTQRELDDPEFLLIPDWTLPEESGPPEDVLGIPDEAAIMKPHRLCPSPPPEMVEEKAASEVEDQEASGDSTTGTSIEASSSSQSQPPSEQQSAHTAEQAESASQKSSQQQSIQNAEHQAESRSTVASVVAGTANVSFDNPDTET